MLPITTIIGNVVADPELKFLPNGKALVNFRVAANSRKKEPNGEWVDGDSTFLSVSAFEGLAENVANDIQKGTKVIVIGRLTQRDVEKDGQKRTYYGITADDIGIQVPRWADKGQQQGGFQNQNFPQAGQQQNQQGGFNNQQQRTISQDAPF